MPRDPYVTLMGALGAVGVPPGAEGAPFPPPPHLGPPAHKPRYGGWPAPAVPRKRAWSGATGHVHYILQSGDTLSGLAKTYLDSYPRWREIWTLNEGHAGWHPSSIPVGSHLAMPPDAIKNARDRGFISPDVVVVTGAVPVGAAPAGALPNTAQGAAATGQPESPVGSKNASAAQATAAGQAPPAARGTAVAPEHGATGSGKKTKRGWWLAVPVAILVVVVGGAVIYEETKQ